MTIQAIIHKRPVSVCGASRRHALKAVAASLLLGAALSVAPAAALAQESASASPATYTGADREEFLAKGAKEEGELMIYTSAPVDDMTVLAKAFEEKYGVKVRLWRAGSEKVLQRTVTEGNAGRFDVDIIETNGPELEALHREGLLQEVKSPYLSDLIPEAIMPHKEWVSTRLNIFAAAYNTNLIKDSEIPQSYEELLDPKWKGKLGIEAEDADWFAGVVKNMGEEKGVQLFRDIVAKNGISVRKGHTLLTNLVASGEVPMALTVYNYKAEQLKSKGAPLNWFTFDPAIARPNGVAMTKGAPHPHAAALFFDFMLSDAQEILLKRDFVPTSTKVDTNLNKMPIKFVDPAIILDENQKWMGLYEEIFTRQSN